MKTTLILITLIIGMNVFTTKPAGQLSGLSEVKGFAVVELFTSEGCSSCPAADEALMDMAKEQRQNVFILGFHVDYWDRLGWKDACSDVAYSHRQQEYGRLFGLNSVYTPQVVINGRTEFVGSDRVRLKQTIEKELKESSASNLDVLVKPVADNKLLIEYKIPSPKNQLLHFALVEKYRETAVKAGENAGRTLRHINSVREFKTVNTLIQEGSVTMSLPKSSKSDNFLLIAYLQDKKTWNIHGAKAFSIY